MNTKFISDDNNIIDLQKVIHVEKTENSYAMNSTYNLKVLCENIVTPLVFEYSNRDDRDNMFNLIKDNLVVVKEKEEKE